MEHSEKQQVAEELARPGWGLIELSGVRVEIMLNWTDRTTGFFSLGGLVKGRRGEQLLPTSTRHLIPTTLCVSIPKPCLGSHMVPKPAPSGDTSGLTAGWPWSLMGGGTNRSWGAILSFFICLFAIRTILENIWVYTAGASPWNCL